MVHGPAARTSTPRAQRSLEEPAVNELQSLPVPTKPKVQASQGRLAVAALSPVEDAEVTDRSSYPVSEGVCRVCLGAQVTLTELAHNCTNCRGRGYCTYGISSNRFDCPFCKGLGALTYTCERSCEACGGTGLDRSCTMDTFQPPPDLVAVVVSDPARREEDGEGAMQHGRFSEPCLLNSLGLLLLIAGFCLLLRKLFFVAGVVLACGASCVASAVAYRVCRLERSKDDMAPCRPNAKEGSLARAPLSSDEHVTIATLVALPNVLLVYFLSEIGIGVQVYSAVAPHHMNVLGNALVSAASLIIGALAVFDWPNWSVRRKVGAAIVPFLSLAVGSVLKGRKYSWAPVLTALFLIPLSLGLLRTYCCRHVRRCYFYRAAGTCLLVCALTLLIIWLGWVFVGGHGWDEEEKMRLRVDGLHFYEYAYGEHPLDYERHCGHSKDLSAYSPLERQNVRSACSTAATVLFLAYANPFVACVCNGIMAAFCFVELLVPDVRDVSRVQQVTQLFCMSIAIAVGGFYASVFFSSASFRLGSMLLAFLAAGFVALLVWGYLEIGQKLVADYAATTKSLRMVHQIWASDWSKAMVVLGFNILLPVGFLVSWLNMKVRRWQGRPDSEARFTPVAERILAEISLWNWASVLCKICVLGEVFFVFQVGVAKVTYIVLSWLNTQLAAMEFWTVVGLAVLVGYAMFLLPPVPGLPVYVFMGIVVSERGRLTPGIGYAGGVAIALAMSFFMKQVACISQYMIGFYLGKSVRIQQLIGVDKVVTRGIEKILKEPGMTLGKVAILVGGPDWPTSVTCGILGLDPMRMVLGTCPVFVLIAPCVFAGAFLARVTPGEDSIWNLLSDASIGVAALVNGISMLMAFYKTAVVVQRHEKELSAHRPEHAKVAELTWRDKARREAYLEVTRWDTLDIRWKAFISAAAVMQLGCVFVFGLLNEACFRDFSVSSDIGAEIPDGLGGDPFKIVREPFGWFPIRTFFLATAMHVVFVKRMGCLAARRPPQGDGEGEAAPAEQPACQGVEAQL